jgi:hypothetical protein
VAHGNRLREQAFPLHHGWQSQMLSRIAEQGRLDAFWAAHSIGGSGDAGTATLPTTVVDTAFADVARVASAVVSALPAESDDGQLVLDAVPFELAITSLRTADIALGTARRLLEQLDDDLALALEERDALRDRRDSLQLEVNWLMDQLDQGGESYRLLERQHHELADALTAQEAAREQLEVDLGSANDHLAATNLHRADLERELDAMRQSRVWRWSKPLRSLRSRLRR